MIKRMEEQPVEWRERQKERERGQITSGLPWLSGAVRFNLVWAGRIAKEQWLGESPGRLAFPACLACRQPLFVLLALFSPLLTASTPPALHPLSTTPKKKKTQRGLPPSMCRAGRYKQERSWWRGKKQQRRMKERWQRWRKEKEESTERQTYGDGDSERGHKTAQRRRRRRNLKEGGEK